MYVILRSYPLEIHCRIGKCLTPTNICAIYKIYRSCRVLKRWVNTKPEKQMSGIDGKVFVITGASSGLGLTLAKELGKRGAEVVVGARRLDRLQNLVRELGQPEETAVKVDVTKREDVDKLLETAVNLYGRVDVLVNNAGYATFSLFEDGHVDEWETCIDINIKGVLYGINAVIPIFKKQKFGQIVNVSSVAGISTSPTAAVYSCTKSALNAISEGLRQELKPYNVRVLNVSPGATDTEGFHGIATRATTNPNAVKYIESFVPVPPTSFSDAVIYAVSQPENVDVNEITFRPSSSVR